MRLKFKIPSIIKFNMEVQNMSTDKRLDEIIRVHKRPNNFVMMDKTFLEDPRLSFKAKGILAYLLSKPDNWKVIVGNLVNYSADGKSSVYAGLKELKECGYYKKIPIRNEAGTRIIRWESSVYEVPFSLLTDFQEVENQEIENQFIEKQERNNNYINNNYINNNYVQSCQTDDNTSVSVAVSQVRKQISYDDFKITHPYDLALIDELVSIMVDALMSKSENIRINSEYKPRELVQTNLLKLTYANIDHVLGQFKEQSNKIKKKPQYILSMLYYSAMELNAHFENLVQSENAANNQI